ncbi:hypothetical protein QEG73_09650 [Chitinophagaceae bacterium 26-R-25]|nr:hypothetical protein [Chitinophagaceae bacterium 26-R-25]
MLIIMELCFAELKGVFDFEQKVYGEGMYEVGSTVYEIHCDVTF